MTLHEIHEELKAVKPGICRDMESTCDECPFGKWNYLKQHYECGFRIIGRMIENYEKEQAEYEHL